MFVDPWMIFVKQEQNSAIALLIVVMPSLSVH